MKECHNLAFIDGQNLHMGTKESGWRIDHKKFRIYLKENYKVKEVYYFLGFMSKSKKDLYDKLSKYDFITIFKNHNQEFLSKKKGNIDSDLIFEVLKIYIDRKDFDQIILVSGDGDYKKLVDYLINKNKFEKILFPNNKSSSLYKNLTNKYFDFLNKNGVKEKIIFVPKNKKGA